MCACVCVCVCGFVCVFQQNLLSVRVSFRCFWLYVWLGRNDRVRWPEGERVGNVSGLQHYHLHSCYFTGLKCCFSIFSLYHLHLCVTSLLCVQSASQTVYCACRLWAGWSLQWLLNMQTTSSKDSPPLCPSSRLQSFHISCWRTSTPLGKRIHTHAHSLISAAENKHVINPTHLL